MEHHQEDTTLSSLNSLRSEALQIRQFFTDGNTAPLSSWKAIVWCDQNSSQLWYWKLFPSPKWGSPQSFTSFYFCVFSAIVMNIMGLHTAQSNAVIISDGLVIMRSFHHILVLLIAKCVKYQNTNQKFLLQRMAENNISTLLLKYFLKVQGNYQVWWVSLLGWERLLVSKK